VPVSPDESGQIVVAIDRRASGRFGPVIPLGAEEFRRSLYLQVRRSMPLSLLEPFDLPSLVPNCDRRVASTNPTQSLVMLNSAFVIQQAEALAARVQREAGSELESQFALAWRLAYGRTPSSSDTEQGLAFLQAGFAATSEEKSSSERSKLALDLLCQALLSSHAFLYVE